MPQEPKYLLLGTSPTGGGVPIVPKSARVSKIAVYRRGHAAIYTCFRKRRNISAD